MWRSKFLTAGRDTRLKPATVDFVSITEARSEKKPYVLRTDVSAKRNEERLESGKGVRMEVKINREIRNYTESMFFGLSMRQSIFSALAAVIAVALYFFLKPLVGAETVSWLCILGAVPFAAMGFVSYHGMNAEQFLWVWLRSELIEPKVLTFAPSNLYYEVLKDIIGKYEKEVSKGYDESSGTAS